MPLTNLNPWNVSASAMSKTLPGSAQDARISTAMTEYQKHWRKTEMLRTTGKMTVMGGILYTLVLEAAKHLVISWR